jgi:putative SOS response-associated peptidase YedK
MCYAFTPVRTPDGGLIWLPKKVIEQFEKEGLLAKRSNGFYYAKDRIGIYYWKDRNVAATAMRWDLVPPDFLPRHSLQAMLREKNSRSKKSKGFSSYNARIESVASLVSFRDSWRSGKRFAVPASAFLERPNMEGAPGTFRGKEYCIHLEERKYLCGIYAHWENPAGECLDSCTIITVDSIGNDKLRGIWHERCPMILDEARIQEWLDPATPPERAMEMARVFPAEQMHVEELRPQAPENPQTSLFQ